MIWWLGETLAVFTKRPALPAVVPCVVAQQLNRHRNIIMISKVDVCYSICNSRAKSYLSLVGVEGNFRNHGWFQSSLVSHSWSNLWGFQYYNLRPSHTIYAAIRSKETCHTAVVSTKHTFIQSASQSAYSVKKILCTLSFYFGRLS